MKKAKEVLELLEGAKLNKQISLPMYNLVKKYLTNAKTKRELDGIYDIIITRVDSYKDSADRKEFFKKLLDIFFKWIKM